MTPERDETWSNFASTEDFKTFCQEAIPEIFLRSTVNENVRKEFEIVKKLLEHSYFEYKFYDVACLKAVLTLEMALRLRYQEMFDKPYKNGLKNLLLWYYNEGYFEVGNQFFIEWLLRIRNNAAHPADHCIAGPFGRRRIISVLNLINDVYENKELRKERFSIINKVNDRLAKFKQGGFLIDNGEKRYIAFEGAAIFLNNKGNRQVFTTYIIPIYGIGDDYAISKEVYQRTNLILTANHVKVKSDKIIFSDSEGRQIKICKLWLDEDKTQYSKWLDVFEKYNERVQERTLIASDYNQWHQQHLSLFYKEDD